MYFSVQTVFEGKIIPQDTNLFFNESIDLNLFKNSFREVLNILESLLLCKLSCVTLLMSWYSWISSVSYSFLVNNLLELLIIVLSMFWLLISSKYVKLSLSISCLQLILFLLLCISYNYLVLLYVESLIFF